MRAMRGVRMASRSLVEGGYPEAFVPISKVFANEVNVILMATETYRWGYPDARRLHERSTRRCGIL